MTKKSEDDIQDMQVGDTVVLKTLEDLAVYLMRDYRSVHNSVWRIYFKHNKSGPLRDYFGSQYKLELSDDFVIKQKSPYKKRNKEQ